MKQIIKNIVPAGSVRCCITTAMLILSLMSPSFAGNLDSSGTPASGSNMPTLTDIYNQLNDGTTSAPAGAFQEPLAGPTAGTGKTLTEIKNKLPAPDNANGAAAGDVLTGKTFWGLRTDGTWGLKTGTLASQNNVTGGNGLLSFTIPDGYYSGKTATASDTNLISGNIKNGVNIFGVAGSSSVVDTSSANAVASDILSGKSAFVNGALINGSITSQNNVSGANGLKSFTIPDGYYSGKTATASDTNLTSGNIKNGTTIFGVAGTYRGCTCATGNTSPAGRWCDNNNGTVTDMTTCLVWLKDADCPGMKTWSLAITYCIETLRNGVCSLTDGSVWGDWRLPTKNELVVLTTGTEYIRSSAMYKFINVQPDWYWSSSTDANDTAYAWVVLMNFGGVFAGFKTGNHYVLPVRGGQ